MLSRWVELELTTETQLLHVVGLLGHEICCSGRYMLAAAAAA